MRWHLRRKKENNKHIILGTDNTDFTVALYKHSTNREIYVIRA